MKKNMDSLSSGKSAKAEAPAKTQEVPTEEKPKTQETTAETPAEKAPEQVATPEAATPTTPDVQADSFESLFPEPRAALGAPPSWLWWVLLLIVSIVIAVAGYALTQQNLRSWLSTEPSPTPSASASATPTETPSPTATPTETPTPTPTLDPATISLRVLNGSTTTGAAAKAKTTLEAAGFKVRTTGNAKTQTYTSTMVYYQTGKLAEAEAVKAALTGYTVVLEESSLADPDNVLVVIGK